MYPPQPNELVFSHYGRIYYPRGSRVYRTEPPRYGLQGAHNYWQFPADVTTLVSCPGVIYIGTAYMLYKVTNIDGDGAVQVEELQDCGCVCGTECYDPDGVSAYFMTDRGFMKATPEGVKELTYTDCAMPYFKHGSMTVTEQDGLKYLVGVFKDGTQNPLANREYSAAELLRHSL